MSTTNLKEDAGVAKLLAAKYGCKSNKCYVIQGSQIFDIHSDLTLTKKRLNDLRAIAGDKLPVVVFMTQRNKRVEKVLNNNGFDVCWFPKGLYGEHLCHLPPKLKKANAN